MRAEVQALVLVGVAPLSFDAGMLLLKVRGNRMDLPMASVVGVARGLGADAGRRGSG